jgi:hypothetical protein
LSLKPGLRAWKVEPGAAVGVMVWPVGSSAVVAPLEELEAPLDDEAPEDDPDEEEPDEAPPEELLEELPEELLSLPQPASSTVRPSARASGFFDQSRIGDSHS